MTENNPHMIALTEATGSEADISSKEIDMPFSELKVDTVHQELLTAHRDAVKSSDFRGALNNVQEFLDAIPAEPKPLGYIAQASTEPEMHAAIKQERTLPSDHESLNTWAAVVEGKDMVLMTSPAFGLVGVSIASGFMSEMRVVAQDTFGYVSLGALLFSLVWSLICVFVISDPWGPMTTIRNKIFRRKAYKLEVKRLLIEAESARERYDRIVSIRKAKLATAQKAIGPVANDFALSNPGQSLKIVSKGNKLTLDIVQADGYSHVDSVAAQLMSGLPAKPKE